MLQCNVFQYCGVLRFLGHIMVLLVCGLVGMSYWAVVPLAYGPMLFSHSPLKIVAAVFVILLFTFLVSPRRRRAQGLGG